ncbi:hypothetical protein DB35_04010 [Streptomyces abyssalis]|uniref:Uncharacterized protein n=1 Tax=Streptomyces abyssalis TaxID=933944 RepID=A0A1E7JQ76_9ACTN|nr:hypothetical protein [Streptomyces abyssalis]OEU90406.1 hypothetical protein AN215_13120 [Streptomyces abyssalis]OEU95142.1 hypothetical protein DB35_04010 [Streptomyces abyssalis]
MTRLREAETALSEADGRRDAIGGHGASANQFHVAYVLYEFKDLEESIAAMRESLRPQPKQERQGGKGAFTRTRFLHSGGSSSGTWTPRVRHEARSWTTLLA